MNTLIIDDHGLFRAGITHVLKAIDSNITVAEFENVAAAIASPSDQRSIDLVLLDLHLPDSQFRDNILQCREHFKLAKIVIISGETSGDRIQQSIQLGASGFIPKSADTERLAIALDLIVAGGIYLPPEILSYLIEEQTQDSLDSSVFEGLTERQYQSLKLAINGVSNAVICEELGLKLPTVKQHLRSAYQLLGVHSRTQAVARCAELGGLVYRTP